MHSLLPGTLVEKESYQVYWPHLNDFLHVRMFHEYEENHFDEVP